jgi:hypothetical protein
MRSLARQAESTEKLAPLVNSSTTVTKPKRRPRVLTKLFWALMLVPHHPPPPRIFITPAVDFGAGLSRN